MRWPVRLAVIGLLLLSACSEKEPNPYAPESKVFRVPADYSLLAALSAAESGDKILLTAAGTAVGDFELPAGVSLSWYGENTELFQITGSLSCADSGAGVLIEGLKIVNLAGSGLVLRNCALEVNNCWIVDCEGAGVELAGSSSVYLHNSDLENCRPGILIRDVFSSGHHKSDTAPSITDNNFIGNQPILTDVIGDDIEEALGPNLVFSNVAAGDTVYVRWNWWGAPPGVVDPEDTVWDHKDQPDNHGLADASEGYSPLTEIEERDWRD